MELLRGAVARCAADRCCMAGGSCCLSVQTSDTECNKHRVYIHLLGAAKKVNGGSAKLLLDSCNQSQYCQCFVGFDDAVIGDVLQCLEGFVTVIRGMQCICC